MGEDFRKGVVQDMLAEKGIDGTFREARRIAKEYVYDLRSKGKISFSDPKESEIPSIHVVRKTLPEVWEDTTMVILGVGVLVHTHYDPGFEKGKFESFPSLEATVKMHIEEPFSEPRFHMQFLAGSFGDYKAEMEGVKDHWVLNPGIVVDLIKNNRFDEVKDYKEWLYSYSQRIRSYPCLDIEAKPKIINQIQSVINNLVKDPLSRSAQIITWDPRFDQNDGQFAGVKFDDYHAPCLQRLWFRLIPFEKGYKLNVNSHWRSRDHLKAVPHNIYGLLEGMLEPIRLELQAALHAPIVMARYCDDNDSLHIYGQYLDPNRQGLDAERYLEDIFRVARGVPIKDRLYIPGTFAYNYFVEEISQEYKKRKENPNYDRPHLANKSL